MLPLADGSIVPLCSLGREPRVRIGLRKQYFVMRLVQSSFFCNLENGLSKSSVSLCHDNFFRRGDSRLFVMHGSSSAIHAWRLVSEHSGPLILDDLAPTGRVKCHT